MNIVPAGCPAKNYGFDVTPQRLVTAFITERGLCAPSANGLRGLFSDLAPRRPAPTRFPRRQPLEPAAGILAHA